MSNYVLVIDTNKQPLNPCHPSVARKLLNTGKASVFREYPFTIILKKPVSEIVTEPIEIKIDPGSKTTGIALVQGNQVIFGAELFHRGSTIKDSLESRRSLENIPLQVEHIHPKAKGGTNRISNLCLACESCNLKKGTKDINVFLAKKPEVLKHILSQVKRPLKDAAAVNSTRWALFNALKNIGLPVTTGSGGKTKFNRTRLHLPKQHWIDAACVGIIDTLKVLTNKPLLIKATGHGTRQSCRTDKYGFPSRYVPRFKFIKGFQTGDIVKAVVAKGKKIGTYIGRVAVRSTGSFNISTRDGLIQGISYRNCTHIHKKDGYSYAT